MKIAVIAPANSTHTVKWVNAFVRRGHHVRLYSLPNHRNQSENLDERVHLTYLRKGGGLGYFQNGKELGRLLASFSPDVVSAHYLSGYCTLARLSKARPVMMSVWGSDIFSFPKKSPLHKAVVVKNLKAADRVASTSAIMAREIEAVYPGIDDIAVTPFGVDTRRFAPREVPHEGFVIGIIKNLDPIYGIDTLLRAFERLLVRAKKEGVNPLVFRLQICGGGDDKERLMALSRELNIQERVKFFGHVPNDKMPDILCGMDVVALPSIHESFGVSAVEAMACEIAVVTSDAPGFKETVEDGVTGFLTPVGDHHALCQKLWELFSDTSLRLAMGKAGRERVLALYDWEENVDTMLKALNETAARFARLEEERL